MTAAAELGEVPAQTVMRVSAIGRGRIMAMDSAYDVHEANRGRENRSQSKISTINFKVFMSSHS